VPCFKQKLPVFVLGKKWEKRRCAELAGKGFAGFSRGTFILTTDSRKLPEQDFSPRFFEGTKCPMNGCPFFRSKSNEKELENRLRDIFVLA